MSTMVWDFQGKRVLVTGGASGIGFAIARAFCDAGATVVLLGSNSATLDGAVANLKSGHAGEIYSFVCDLAAVDQIVHTAGEISFALGGIDILINNAGVGGSGPLTELTDAEVDLQLNVNLRATIILTRELIRGMLDRGAGVVVNIASQAAKRGFPGITHYTASKAGVLGFTTSLAVEVAPAVRVNAICPGTVMTPMMQANIDKTSRTKNISRDEAIAEWSEGIPMGRMQQPEDVANAALFLSSDLASEITGEALNVSGGQTTT
jgi:NAD(P)-dependent dehydrogenase (short-subunit alcohol dehydrogenase family)